jgi:hypothetical protein
VWISRLRSSAFFGVVSAVLLASACSSSSGSGDNFPTGDGGGASSGGNHDGSVSSSGGSSGGTSSGSSGGASSGSSGGASSGSSSGAIVDSGPPCGATVTSGAIALTSNYLPATVIADGGYAYAYSDGTSTACIDSTNMCTQGMTTVANATGSLYGAGIGFNLNQAMSTSTAMTAINTYTPTGVGISYTVSSLPPQGLRLAIGDYVSATQGTDYCAILSTTSGTVPWAAFNSKCYDNTGTFLSGPPVNPIHMEFQIPSGTVAEPFDFCVDSVAFATTLTQPDSGGGGGGGSSCTWTGGPSSAKTGAGELTCYTFAMGTANDKTFCGYNGSETNSTATGGACDLGKADTVPNVANPAYFAAFPVGTFAQGQYCGMCLNLSYGGKSIVATVVDECATCPTSGHIDLNATAALALGVGSGGATGDATSGVTWTSVSCPVTGDIVAVLNGGSSSQIYFQNVVFPVASAKASGGASATQSTGFWNFGSNVAGQTITLTDTLGHTTSGVVPGGGGTMAGAQFTDACP